MVTSNFVFRSHQQIWPAPALPLFYLYNSFGFFSHKFPSISPISAYDDNTVDVLQIQWRLDGRLQSLPHPWVISELIFFTLNMVDKAQAACFICPQLGVGVGSDGLSWVQKPPRPRTNTRILEWLELEFMGHGLRTELARHRRWEINRTKTQIDPAATNFCLKHAACGRTSILLPHVEYIQIQGPPASPPTLYPLYPPGAPTNLPMCQTQGEFWGPDCLACPPPCPLTLTSAAASAVAPKPIAAYPQPPPHTFKVLQLL